MKYAKEQLVSNNDVDTCFVECMLCGGFGPVERTIHVESCPFADPDVSNVVFVADVKCPLCDNTGRPCSACNEYHSKESMCVPHEVRMKHAANICPRCNTKEKL